MSSKLIGSGLALSGGGEPQPAEATIEDGQLRVQPTQQPLTDGILLPGLVNLHDHLRGFVPTGRVGEGRSLAEAITVGNRAQAAAEPRDYEALTALASARQILSGVTSVIDHVYPLHRDGLLEAVVAGHSKVGIRGAVALGVLTVGPDELTSPVESIIALAERAADTVVPREQLFLAPVSLRSTRLEDYRSVAQAADRLGVGLYTHIAETHNEVEDCLQRTGLRPVEFLHDCGFLRPGTVLVHGVQLDESEIDLLVRSEATLVYCPTNHLRFAKGFAPIVDVLAAGGRVGLGIDGMESLFHEMRAAIHAQGQANEDTSALSSVQAFEMAVRIGADVLALPSGFAAHDLVRIDTSSPAFHPLLDPLWSVVHRASPRHVTDVVVGGRHVVRGGDLTQVDQGELANAAADSLTRLAERSGAAPPRVIRPKDHAAPSQIGTL